MTDTSYNQNYAPFPTWSARQAPVPATTHNVPSSIAASSQVQSSLIVTEGYSLISIGVTPSQAGNLSVQRYLDAGGTVLQGAAILVAMTANTAANLDILDGKPFASFKVTITNAAGSTSNLTNFALLLQSSVASLSDTGTTLAETSASNTSGGASTFFAAAQTNTVTAVKTSAGNLYGFSLKNTTASDVYMQFFDLATGSVTLGTTPPKIAFWIPANGLYDYVLDSENKISFATAISIAATTTATGATAPATGVVTNILYK